MTESVDAIVVGAGVIGLAIARRLALDGREVIVLGSQRRSGAPYECTAPRVKPVLWLSLPGLKTRLDRLV